MIWQSWDEPACSALYFPNFACRAACRQEENKQARRSQRLHPTQKVTQHLGRFSEPPGRAMRSGDTPRGWRPSDPTDLGWRKRFSPHFHHTPPCQGASPAAEGRALSPTVQGDKATSEGQMVGTSGGGRGGGEGLPSIWGRQPPRWGSSTEPRGVNGGREPPPARPTP